MGWYTKHLDMTMWDSTWEAHEVTGLKPGETYTLRETVAPEGYTLTSDTTFTLKEDGTVNKDTTQQPYQIMEPFW